MEERLKRIMKFFTEDVFKEPTGNISKQKMFFHTCWTTLYLCSKRFVQDRLVAKASALTYSTLLALVPIIAILFAVARGFGFDQMMEEQIRVGMVGQGEAANYILEFVKRYLSQTKNGIFIGVGLVLLLYTVIMLSANIEKTVNRIWHIKKGRSLYRKITDYFSMFLLIPILLVVSSGLSIFTMTMLKSMASFEVLLPVFKFLFRTIPFVFTWGMFIVFYIFMPNTKVKFKHAIIPGILAGSAFQGTQLLYIIGQVSVSRYNAIYGSFAALPLLLLWMQISWSICLFGVQMTYASQNIKNFSFDKDTRNISHHYFVFVCIVICSLITKRFLNREQPYTVSDLSSDNHIPLRLAKQALDTLEDLNIVHETTTDEKGDDIVYLPSIDSSQLSVGLIKKLIDTNGSSSDEFNIDVEHRFSKAWQLLEDSKDESFEKLNCTLVKDL
jgi:membrane protein